ncbi:glycosyltransferase family A protein [Streptomyces sp. NPDC051677]|uniref:glycosyltransferase family A protein n=1 Tax=Streptomyces sp. NPDC051677 TaxID=3365669 RepID=UPI0037D1E453
MRFKILMPGWNCYPYLERSLRSVAAQTDPAFDVCVVDDASDDPRQAKFITDFCADQGWMSVVNEERRGALYNLYHAARLLEPEPEDVIVFVDADDRLIHPRVLERLRWYYDTYRPLLTHGSYICDPRDDLVTPALNFPDEVVATNAYRAFTGRDDPDATWFNHLRSMRYELFAQLTPEDFTFDNGEWFMACYDTAIMVPAFELAGGRHLMIPEVFYLYTRDNPLSDCRASTAEVDTAHQVIFSRPPKQPLGPIVRPTVLTDKRPDPSAYYDASGTFLSFPTPESLPSPEPTAATDQLA